MKAYNTLTIISNLYRQKKLTEFRWDIDTYFSNIKSESFSYEHVMNKIAEEKRKSINFKLYRMKKYIRSTWMPTDIYYSDPISTWWIRWNIDIFDNIAQSFRFHFNKEKYFDTIDKAIWIYKNDLFFSLLRTFNPLYWLNKIITIFINIPFYILWFSGFNISEESFSNSIITKCLKLVMWIITLSSWIVTIFTFFWLDKNDIMNLFIKN